MRGGVYAVDDEQSAIPLSATDTNDRKPFAWPSREQGITDAKKMIFFGYASLIECQRRNLAPSQDNLRIRISMMV